MILDDVPAFYRGTSPNKFFDYVASGLPVITNYPGWLAELISDQMLGITVSPRDPEAFANALIRLADHPDLRAAMGSNARILAETHFSRHVLADKWRNVLETTYFSYARRSHRFFLKQSYALFKSLADRTAAVLALLLLLPLLILVAVLVRWRLGSPVFFRQ